MGNLEDVANMEAKNDIRGLLKALRDKKNAPVRQLAAQALGKIGGVRAVDPLIEALGDEDPTVRSEVQKALARMGKLTIEPLIYNIKNKNENVSQGAVNSLSMIGTPRAAETMAHTVKAQPPAARWAARDILGKACSALLADAVKDGSSDAQYEAAEALDRLGWQPWNENERADFQRVMEERDRLIREGKVKPRAPIDVSVPTKTETAPAVGIKMEPAVVTEPAPVSDEEEGAPDTVMGPAAAEPAIPVQEAQPAPPIKEAPAPKREEAVKVTPPPQPQREKDKPLRTEAEKAPAGKEAVAVASPPQASKEEPTPKADVHFAVDTKPKGQESTASAVATQAATQAKPQTTEPPPAIPKQKDKRPQATIIADVPIKKSGDGKVDQLISELMTGTTEVRERAAEALDQMGWKPADDAQKVQYLIARREWRELSRLGRQAVDALLGVLSKGDENLRAGAAWALGRIGDRRAVAQLVQAMSTETGWLKRHMILALGDSGDPSAVEPLVKALSDDDGLIRRDASRALAKIGKGSVEPILQAARGKPAPIHNDMVFTLAEMGEPGIDSLLGALMNDDWQIQLTAAEALNRQGWQPANEVEKADYLIIRRQWEALKTMGTPAVKPLVQALQSKDENVRAGAAWTLGAIGDAAAVDSLIEGLKDKHGWVRRDAAQALGQIKDPKAIGPLIQLLGDDDEWVRMESIQSLAHIGEPAEDLLHQASRDNNSRVRSAAAEVLARMGVAPKVQPLPEVPKLEPKVIEAEPRPKEAPLEQAPAPTRAPAPPPARGQDARALVVEKQWDKLAAMGATAIAALIEALKDEDGEVREKAAETLARIGSPAVEPLIIALKDKDNYIRRASARTLGEIKDKRAVDALIVALTDEYDSVRQNSAWALGEIKDPRSADPLIAALKDQYVNVRQYAAWALGVMKFAPALQPLLAALKDKDASVRQYAAAALGEIKDPDAVDLLIATLKDRVSDVRGQAAWALGQIKDPRAVEPLLELLKDEDRWVRRDAVEALGQIKDKRSVDPLIRTLKDGDKWVQTLAASALGNIGDEIAVEALVEALRSPTADVAQAAEDALARMVKSKRG